MPKRSLSLGLFLFAFAPAYADVTAHQVMEFQMKLPMPAGQMPAPFNGPMEILVRVKGDRAYSTFGSSVSIIDVAKSQLTLLDPQNKRYATGSLSDYLGNVQKAVNPAGMPEQARQMLANIKVDVQSRNTGRSERILGIDAEEREIVMSLTIPLPIPGQENGLQIRAKFQCWKAKPGESERLPALGELQAYQARAKNFGDPSSFLRQMFGNMPGVGDNFQKLTDELQTGRTTLRLHGAFYMPGLAALMAQARSSGAKVPEGLDPEAPLVEMRFDLKDINNTDSIPSSLFEIPAGYQQAPFEELVKAMMPAAPKQ